jgi:hypothetical protein
MRAVLRIAAITTAAGLLLAPMAGLASASTTQPATAHAVSVHVTGGETSLTTVSGLVGNLTQGGIALYATAPGTESLLGSASHPRLKFSFPVTGGQVNPGGGLTGTIKHAGGILLINTSNGHTIELSHFNISLTHKHLSAIVRGVRVTVAHLSFAHAKVSVGLGEVKARKISATLTTAGADALDAALGTMLFTPGMRIATVRTLARF